MGSRTGGWGPGVARAVPWTFLGEGWDALWGVCGVQGPSRCSRGHFGRAPEGFSDGLSSTRVTSGPSRWSKTVKNQWYFNDSQIWLLELSGAQEAPERASGTSSGRFRRVPGMLGLPSGGPLGRLGCIGIAPGRSPVTVRCSSERFGALTGRFANR